MSSRKNSTTTKDSTFFKPQAEETYAAEHGGFAPDIKAEMDKVVWCATLIFQFPLWWFSIPAILKGWVDRVFAMGFAYGGSHIYETGVFRGKRATAKPCHSRQAGQKKCTSLTAGMQTSICCSIMFNMACCALSVWTRFACRHSWLMDRREPAKKKAPRVSRRLCPAAARAGDDAAIALRLGTAKTVVSRKRLSFQYNEGRPLTSPTE